MLVIDHTYKQAESDGTYKYFTLRKKFLGKLDDFDSPEERSFEKRHLRAYMKNQDSFNWKGMRFQTQYGKQIIPLTEEEAKAQRKAIIELIAHASPA